MPNWFMYIRHSLGIIGLVSFLFVTNCQSRNFDIHQKLVGNWELKKSSKGQNNSLRYLPVKRKVLLCFTDSGFKVFSDSNMISMGHYRIIDDTMKLNGDMSSRLILKPEIFPTDLRRFFIVIENNGLIITENSVDTMTWFYERIK